MQKRLTRSQVPPEQRWNLGDMFSSVDAWRTEVSALETSFSEITQYQGRLGEGVRTFYACLNTYEALLERLSRVVQYAGLMLSEDGTDPLYQALGDRATALEAAMRAATSFVASEVVALPEGTVERYRSEEPALDSLQLFLDLLLESREHQLSPETEAAMAALGEIFVAPYLIYERSKSSDIQFAPFVDGDGREVVNSFALYEDSYERSANVVTRRNGYASFIKGLAAYQHTLAATFATDVKKNMVIARLRGYETTTHMLLDRQQFPIQAYHNLLTIIQTELAPHMRRLARLRQRVLGLDKMMYCDLEAPMDLGYNPDVSYSEAAEMIIDSVAPLGSEYQALIRRGFKERWVDWGDNIGKSTGAFCLGPYGAHSYVMITWTNTMTGAFTLAHEMGHAGHFELTNSHQRFLNIDIPLSFIEAPSTLNELLLGRQILARTTDQRVRRWVLMQLLRTYHHNFVRHLLEAELQRRIYARAEAGEPVNASTLSTTKGEILDQFYDGVVEIDEGARLTWIRQPHYYMGLYPYTYSAGLTVATTVAQAIFEEGQPAVDRWLKTLKAGAMRRPLELMQMAGVDMSTPAPIRKAVAYVGSLVDELEASFA